MPLRLRRRVGSARLQAPHHLFGKIGVSSGLLCDLVDQPVGELSGLLEQVGHQLTGGRRRKLVELHALTPKIGTLSFNRSQSRAPVGVFTNS